MLGVTDGSFTEVLEGDLKEGQEVVVSASTPGSGSQGALPPGVAPASDCESPRLGSGGLASPPRQPASERAHHPRHHHRRRRRHLDGLGRCWCTSPRRRAAEEARARPDLRDGARFRLRARPSGRRSYDSDSPPPRPLFHVSGRLPSTIGKAHDVAGGWPSRPRKVRIRSEA